jgi:excisionase family DNA binding protein
MRLTAKRCSVYSPDDSAVTVYPNGGENLKMLTTREVADQLQTSCDTVERLIRLGELEAERLTPRGRFRIRPASLQAYVKRYQITLKDSQPAA